MEATNYLRTVMELSARKAPGSQIPRFFWVTAQRAKAAPKFVMPEGGRLFNTDLTEMETPVRLPFPMVVLEFPTYEYPLRPLLLSLPEENRGDSVEDDKGRDRMIVIATQKEDEPITLALIHREIGTDNWLWAPFTVAIASKREITEDNPTGLWMAVNKRYPNGTEKPLSDGWMAQVAGRVMKAALYAVYDLVHALNTRRVDVADTEPRKLNKAAKRRGALPFDSYKVLSIRLPNEEENKPTLPLGDAADRRLSREHERRGHWRHYKSGKRVWIDQLTVNKGQGGKIIKDYQLKAGT